MEEVRRDKKKKMNSNDITKLIVRYLLANDHFATRVSSAGRYLPGQNKFIPSTTAKGTADIHAVIDGKHVSIEVKTGYDKQSEAQKQMQEAIQKAGGIYLVIYSFSDFMNWYMNRKQKV